MNFSKDTFKKIKQSLFQATQTAFPQTCLRNAGKISSSGYITGNLILIFNKTAKQLTESASCALKHDFNKATEILQQIDIKTELNTFLNDVQAMAHFNLSDFSADQWQTATGLSFLTASICTGFIDRHPEAKKAVGIACLLATSCFIASSMDAISQKEQLITSASWGALSLVILFEETLNEWGKKIENISEQASSLKKPLKNVQNTQRSVY